MPNRPLNLALVLTLSLPATAAFAIAGTAPATAPPAKPAAILFSEMDADRDSRITKAEWQGNPVSFAQHDANGDGVLAGPEVAIPAATGGTPAAQPGVHDRGRLERLFRNLDDNRDGRLSPAELKAKKKFERLDTNRDKAVSRDEFLKQ